MHDVNYWLLGLAFVLGLLLTFALTVRRVKREVPVSSSGGAAAEPEAKTDDKKTDDKKTEEDSSG